MITLKGKQIGVLVALVLGMIMLGLPARPGESYQFDPVELGRMITERADQLAPSDLAQWIVEQQGDYQLIDIRSAQEFQAGHIPGAAGMPLAELLQPAALRALANGKTIVLYGNGQSHAAQAWLVLKAAGVDALVLEGGLNAWNRDVLNPQPPPAGGGDDEILRYNNAAATAGFFSGGNAAPTAAAPAAKPSASGFKAPVKKKKIKGC
jgi:rhodanese-related sulfurtransferase